MATIFTDVAKEAAFANSVKVQRYHGGLSNTLTAEVTLANLGTANNVVYLCPIPWYARLKDISIVFDAEAKYATTNPKVSISMRSMKDKCAKTAMDLSTLEYTKILATQNDHDSAIGNKTLADITLTSGNEIVIATNVNPLTVEDTSAVTKDTEYALSIPFSVRKLTLAECYSYKKNVPYGSETKEKVVFADNAKEYTSKEHYGMLTMICTTGGAGAITAGNALISVTYIDPAPSSISQGSITRNGSNL